MSKFSHENSKSKKGHNFVKKNGGLSPLLVWVPLLIVNNYSEFLLVNIFSNNRDIRKCQSFRTKIIVEKGAQLCPKNWMITSPTGMGSPFDSEQLL